MILYLVIIHLKYPKIGGESTIGSVEKIVQGISEEILRELKKEVLKEVIASGKWKEDDYIKPVIQQVLILPS